jgi:copper(I)-binding protein
MALESREGQTERSGTAAVTSHVYECAVPGRSNLGKTDGQGCDLTPLTITGADDKSKVAADTKFQVHDQSLTSRDKAAVNAAMLTVNNNDNATDRAVAYLDPKSPDFSKRAGEVRTRLQDMTNQGLFGKDEVAKWDKSVAAATGKSDAVSAKAEPSEAPGPIGTAGSSDKVASGSGSDPKFQVHDQSLKSADKAVVNAAMTTVNNNDNATDRAVAYLDPKSPDFAKRADEVRTRLQDLTTQGLFGKNEVAKWDKSVAAATGKSDAVSAQTEPVKPLEPKLSASAPINHDPQFNVHDQSLTSIDRVSVNTAMIALNMNNNAQERAIKFLNPNSPDFGKRASEIRERLQDMVHLGMFEQKDIDKWDTAVSATTALRTA